MAQKLRDIWKKKTLNELPAPASAVNYDFTLFFDCVLDV